MNSSVWASNNRYYIDGKPTTITTKFYKKLSPDTIREQLAIYKGQNNYRYFNANIEKFVSVNKVRLNYIIDEAYNFIQQAATSYPRENLVIYIYVWEVLEWE